MVGWPKDFYKNEKSMVKLNINSDIYIIEGDSFFQPTESMEVMRKTRSNNLINAWLNRQRNNIMKKTP